jgi:hypothetical protein
VSRIGFNWLRIRSAVWNSNELSGLITKYMLTVPFSQFCYLTDSWSHSVMFVAFDAVIITASIYKTQFESIARV